MNSPEKNNMRPDCFQCTHFYITHEPAHPYGCLGMGFKSQRLPAVVVYESSEIECQLFKKKKGVVTQRH